MAFGGFGATSSSPGTFSFGTQQPSGFGGFGTNTGGSAGFNAFGGQGSQSTSTGSSFGSGRAGSFSSFTFCEVKPGPCGLTVADFRAGSFSVGVMVGQNGRCLTPDCQYGHHGAHPPGDNQGNNSMVGSSYGGYGSGMGGGYGSSLGGYSGGYGSSYGGGYGSSLGGGYGGYGSSMYGGGPPTHPFMQGYGPVPPYHPFMQASAPNAKPGQTVTGSDGSNTQNGPSVHPFMPGYGALPPQNPLYGPTSQNSMCITFACEQYPWTCRVCRTANKTCREICAFCSSAVIEQLHQVIEAKNTRYYRLVDFSVTDKNQLKRLNLG